MIFFPEEQNEFFNKYVIGKTVTDVTGCYKNSTEITFTFSDGSSFTMYHSQNCCESVDVDDVCGDVKDLIGSPILKAEIVTNIPFGSREKYDTSFTWTFYKFATINGYVDIKWYGVSNGYYSEEVNIEYKANEEDTLVN